MEIEDECFETDVDNEMFLITVSGEGDCSYDGGYSFELVRNTAALSKEQAGDLIKELTNFVGE